MQDLFYSTLPPILQTFNSMFSAMYVPFAYFSELAMTTKNTVDLDIFLHNPFNGSTTHMKNFLDFSIQDFITIDDFFGLERYNTFDIFYKIARLFFPSLRVDATFLECVLCCVGLLAMVFFLIFIFEKLFAIILKFIGIGG